jgi:hypothetical protein
MGDDPFELIRFPGPENNEAVDGDGWETRRIPGTEEVDSNEGEGDVIADDVIADGAAIDGAGEAAGEKKKGISPAYSILIWFCVCTIVGIWVLLIAQTGGSKEKGADGSEFAELEAKIKKIEKNQQRSSRTPSTWDSMGTAIPGKPAPMHINITGAVPTYPADAATAIHMLQQRRK